MVMVATASLTGIYALSRKDFKATLHRETANQVYETDASGMIVNPVRIHLTNLTEKNLHIQFLTEKPAALSIAVAASSEGTGSIELQALEKSTAHLLLRLPREAFRDNFGLANVEFKAVDQWGSEIEFELKVVGPAN